MKLVLHDILDLLNGTFEGGIKVIVLGEFSLNKQIVFETTLLDSIVFHNGEADRLVFRALLAFLIELVRPSNNISLTI